MGGAHGPVTSNESLTLVHARSVKGQNCAIWRKPARGRFRLAPATTRSFEPVGPTLNAPRDNIPSCEVGRTSLAKRRPSGDDRDHLGPDDQQGLRACHASGCAAGGHSRSSRGERGRGTQVRKPNRSSPARPIPVSPEARRSGPATRRAEAVSSLRMPLHRRAREALEPLATHLWRPPSKLFWSPCWRRRFRPAIGRLTRSSPGSASVRRCVRRFALMRLRFSGFCHTPCLTLSGRAQNFPQQNQCSRRARRCVWCIADLRGF